MRAALTVRTKRIRMEVKEIQPPEISRPPRIEYADKEGEGGHQQDLPQDVGRRYVSEGDQTEGINNKGN